MYHWPPPSGEWIQEKLQNQIAAMHSDGYEPEAVNALLRCLADLTAREAERFSCNVSRATFFEALVRLEITQ